MKSKFKILAIILTFALLLTSFDGCKIKTVVQDEELANQKEQETTITPQLLDGWENITVGGVALNLGKVTLVINNKIVKLPCTLEKLLEQAELSLAYDGLGSFLTQPEIAKDYEGMVSPSVEPNDRESFGFRDEGFFVEVYNPSSQKLSPKDCLVFSTGIRNNGTCKGYEIPAGFAFKKEWSREKVEKAFGAPVQEYDDKLEGEHILLYYFVGTESGVMYRFGFFDEPCDDCNYISFQYFFEE